MPPNSLVPALAALRAGRMVILTDDADRENEGDLCMDAAQAMPCDVAFMARHGRGLICAPIVADRADALALPPMVAQPQDPAGAAFAVSCDASAHMGSGISAQDRARTLRALAAPEAQAADFIRPGHIFPLRGRPGGVVARPGHTEGCLDLLALAGLGPVGVLCEVVRDDGTLAQKACLEALAQAHNLPIVSMADLLAHRLAHTPLGAKLPGAHAATSWGAGGAPHEGPVTLELAWGTATDAAPKVAPGALRISVTLAESILYGPGHAARLALACAGQAARASGCIHVRWPGDLDPWGRALLAQMGLVLL